MKMYHNEKVCRNPISVNNILDDDNTTTSESGEDNKYLNTIKSDQVNNVSENEKASSTMIEIKLNGTPVIVQIDSGCDASILSHTDFLQLTDKPKLTKTSHKLYSFESDRPLPLLGMFTGVIKTATKLEPATFYLVPSKGKVGNILGAKNVDEIRFFSHYTRHYERPESRKSGTRRFDAK